MSLKEEFAIRALSKKEPFSKLCQEFNITRKTSDRAEGAPVNWLPFGN